MVGGLEITEVLFSLTYLNNFFETTRMFLEQELIRGKLSPTISPHSRQCIKTYLLILIRCLGSPSVIKVNNISSGRSASLIKLMLLLTSCLEQSNSPVVLE